MKIIKYLLFLSILASSVIVTNLSYADTSEITTIEEKTLVANNDSLSDEEGGEHIS